MAEKKPGGPGVRYTEDVKLDEDGCWDRRSGLEKRLIVASVICFLVAVGVLVALILVAEENKKHREAVLPTSPSPQVQGKDVCMTEDCVMAAATVAGKMDKSVDPCEDFYQYSCGGWLEKNIIPEDRSAFSTFHELDDKLLIKLRNELEMPHVDGQATSLRELKDLYQSCLDTETLETLGATPLVNFLLEFGGWPLLSASWDESTFDLESLLIKFSEHNNVPIIYMGVRRDFKDPSIRRLAFDQPGFGLQTRDEYLQGRNDTKLMAYETFITSIALALGADPVTARYQVEDLVNFEIQLANISVPSIERFDEDKRYNLMTVSQMSQNYSEFDWLRYVQGIMAMEGVNYDITAEETTINLSPPYFEQLFPILGNTPKRTVANYVMWMMIKERVKLLDKSFRDIINVYNEAVSGAATEPPRWKVCSTYVNSAMMLATARLYVDKHFSEATKTNLLSLISYLRGAFNKVLAEADWMDKPTQDIAREKLRIMKEKIGYPDAIKNNTYLDDYYKHHMFDPDKYFENVLTKLKLDARKHLWELRQPVDLSEWSEKPVVVNAYYRSSNNEIVFPAGILQAPFYSGVQPNSMNFGSIGGVIGHEMTHGFDNRGRQRDQYGNNRQWWPEEVIARFENKTHCFINQTSSFLWPEAGMNVNGKLTIGEDIADSGGVGQSFVAYREWVADRGSEEPSLPGLDLTHNQLFFISWGQFWCTKIRKELAVRLIFLDYHSPNRLRAVSPVQNSPHFAEAFQCEKNTYMNPEEKCKLW